jgi:hypothetical protein
MSPSSIAISFALPEHDLTDVIYVETMEKKMFNKRRLTTAFTNNGSMTRPLKNQRFLNLLLNTHDFDLRSDDGL